MLADEVSYLLDPLLVLHIRRKGRLGSVARANHRLVDQIHLAATVKPDVAQEATKVVALRDIGFRGQLTATWQKPFEKCSGLCSVALGRVVWVAGLGSVDEDEAQRLYLTADVDTNRIVVGDADQRCRLRSTWDVGRPVGRCYSWRQLVAGAAIAIRVEGGVAGGIGFVDRLRPGLVVVIGAGDELPAGGLPEDEENQHQRGEQQNCKHQDEPFAPTHCAPVLYLVLLASSRV